MCIKLWEFRLFGIFGGCLRNPFCIQMPSLLNLELQERCLRHLPRPQAKNPRTHTPYTKPANAEKNFPQAHLKKTTPPQEANPSVGLASRPRRLALRVPRPKPGRREGALRLASLSPQRFRAFRVWALLQARASPTEVVGLKSQWGCTARLSR